MIALITGASSGIGRDIARNLSERGYELIIVAKDKTKLEELKNSIKTKVYVECYDLSVEKNCIELFNKYKDIDLLVNNAGFGAFGEFHTTNLDKELNMIDLNIKAVHILTKLYLKEMIKKDKGRILNVASSAGFMPGPLMATYYATKAYVLRLTLSIYEELRRKKSKVKVSVLCPGPVATNFNNVANVKFTVNSLPSEYVANYAVKKMLKNKLIIVPGFSTKLGIFATRFMSNKFLAKIDYNFQKKKEK